jgi:predicted short-subunit dehydrogenase-like oxidoreductase (DUF2520 family)
MTEPRQRTRYWHAALPGVSCLHAAYTSQHFSPHSHEALVIVVTEAGGSSYKSRGSEHAALAALFPALHGTVAAVKDAGLAAGMGGCIARGDLGTVERHLAALEQFSPAAAALYRQLALRTIPLAIARGTLAPMMADRIRNVLVHDPSGAG